MESQHQKQLQQLVTDLQASNEESIGKKLRRLNEFANSIGSGSPDIDIDAIIASISPTDFFMRRVKLELGNLLKRPAPIIEALKSEERLLVSRALQLRWIYTAQESGGDLSDPEFLMNDLFPNVSYMCRKRIIINFANRLNDEQKAEKIFEAIEKKYGLSSAINLLPACSAEYITLILEDNKNLKLSCKQVSQILDRQPDVAILYLENYHETVLKERENNQFICSSLYSPTLTRLAKTRPADFMAFYEKYTDVVAELNFGPRITNLLIKTNTPAIIKYAEKYSKVLNQKQILKRLSKTEFEDFFIALFPKSLNAFQLVFEIGRRGLCGSKESLHFWLQHFSQKKQIEFLKESFKKVYGKNLMDFPEFVTSRLLQMLPVEERQKWVDIKLSTPDSPYVYQAYGNVPNHREGFWTSFRTTDKSIPQLKEFLHNESDIRRRGELVSFLVYTCALNEDKAALADVCRLIIARFRNDQVQVRSEFMETINTKFDLIKLHDEHWSALNELLLLASLNNEFSHNTETNENVLVKSIHYRLVNNQPVEPQIQLLIKMKTRSYCWGESWNILTRHPEYERRCLVSFAEELPGIYPVGTNFPCNSSLTSSIISLAESMSSFNKRHGDKPISAPSFPWLMGVLTGILESEHEINKGRVTVALYGDYAWRQSYFDTPPKFKPAPSILLHFLRIDPQKLRDNLDTVVHFLIHSNNIKSHSAFLKKVEADGAEKLRKEIVAKCLQVFDNKEEIVNTLARTNTIRILSWMMDSRKFMEWIIQFYPTETKVDMSRQDCGNLYDLRKSASICLKNIQHPTAAFSSLVRLCAGDYLKLVLGSLYSLCLNSPEKKVLTFLKEMVNRPVSVKKHAIRLFFTISYKDDISAFLTNLWETEKNPTIRHIIFQRIFHFFVQQPSNNNWNFLKSAIQALTNKDRDCLGELREAHNVESVPPEFLSDYLRICWKALTDISVTIYDTEWVKVNLLQRITPCNLNFLDADFLDELIADNLFILAQEISPSLQTNMIYLGVRYLLLSKTADVQSARLKVVVQALKRLTGPQWNIPVDEEIQTYPARLALSTFIEQICIQSFYKATGSFVGSSSDNIKLFFKTLLDTFEAILDPTDIFTEYLFLQFAIICNSGKHEWKGEGKDRNELFDTGKQLGALVDSTVGIYSPEIIGLFCETLKRFVNTCYKHRLAEGDGDGGRIIHLVDGLLHSTGSVDTKIVAALLLPATYPKGHNLEDKYKEIVEEFKQLPEKSIRIFVNNRLTQTRLPEYYGHFD